MSLIIACISELESDNSRNAKIETLKKFDSDQIRKVFLYAYDPFKQFYINKKLNSLVGTGSGTIEENFDVIFDLLDSLILRKVTGNAAVAEVQKIFALLNKESAYIFANIIRKDLKCGVSDSTINKAYKDLIPVFELQLAAKPERIEKALWPAAVEPKMDGMRVVAIYNGEEVEYLSRAGKPVTTLAHCDTDVIRFLNDAPGILDCEAMSSSFSQSMSDIKRKTAKNTDARLHVFDTMSYSDFLSMSCSTPQFARTQKLAERFSRDAFTYICPVESRVAESKDEAFKIYKEFRALGFEGAIVKNMDAGYRFKRNGNWIKIKPEETKDFEIIGYKEGTGKYTGMLGAFIVDADGIPSNVGGGYSDKERADFWSNRNAMIGQIIEVEFMEESDRLDGEQGKLRHSRFIRLRSICGSKA